MQAFFVDAKRGIAIPPSRSSSHNRMVGPWGKGLSEASRVMSGQNLSRVSSQVRPHAGKSISIRVALQLSWNQDLRPATSAFAMNHDIIRKADVECALRINAKQRLIGLHQNSVPTSQEGLPSCELQERINQLFKSSNTFSSWASLGQLCQPSLYSGSSPS